MKYMYKHVPIHIRKTDDFIIIIIFLCENATVWTMNVLMYMQIQ